MNILEEQEQWFLDLIWRFLDGYIDHNDFYHKFQTRWSASREELWEAAASYCFDFRPLLRFLDAVEAALRRKGAPAALTENIRHLTNSLYQLKRGRCADKNSLCHPRPINVFERPCSSSRLYPCMVTEIRQRLNDLPEQDLVGLWAVGLINPDRYEQNAWGIYYRSFWHARGPLIFILSQPRSEQLGNEESLRRFILDSVLPHEVGHHVQYEQRRRSGYGRALPIAVKEQFAEDYASRMARRGHNQK